ncbi:MAG: hypothetical protein JXR96_21405 [Deltaproteobacteria bacterium]|nr:hypothetical protein [Deltaproteobacteria bacterium]
MRTMLSCAMLLAWLGLGLGACEKSSPVLPAEDAASGVEPAADGSAVAARPDESSGEVEPDKAPPPQGETVDGLKHGHWVYFHAEGKKAAEGDYDKGLKQGEWTYWYSNGQMSGQGKYDKGQKVGAWKAWDEQGQALDGQVFVDGLRSQK